MFIMVDWPPLRDARFQAVGRIGVRGLLSMREMHSRDTR
jgi:hypothetical protein